MPKITYWGEVISLGNQISSWRPLTVVHILSLAFFVAYWIVFLVLLGGVLGINLWLAMIMWGTIGFLVIVVAQLIFYTQFMKGNMISAVEARHGFSNVEPVTFTGLPFAHEMFLSFLVSVMAWLLGLILQLVFLLAYKNDDPEEGCCALTPENRPDLSDPLEWRIFTNTYELTLTACMIAFMWLVRTLVTDFNPLRVVTQIIVNGKKK